MEHNANAKINRHGRYDQRAVEAYKRLERCLFSLDLDARVPIHFHCLAMAMATRETMYCMLHLREFNSDNQMFPMLRQVMELTSYLAFVAQDPDENYEKIVLKDLKAKLSYIGRVDCADDNKVSKRSRAEFLQTEADLHIRHGNALTINEIVDAVAPIELNSEYRFLSTFSESNLVSLDHRYQDVQRGSIESFKPMPMEDMRRLWKLSEHFLDSVIASMEILKERFRESQITDVSHSN